MNTLPMMPEAMKLANIAKGKLSAVWKEAVGSEMARTAKEAKEGVCSGIGEY